jgi:hypothetical protein
MTYERLYSLLSRKSRRRGSMTGFALWDVLLLVTLIASILLAIFLIQQSRVQLRSVQERNATLLWADNKVAGFAAANLRLPCPDSNNDGNEDCGSSTGTLPFLTLGLSGDAAVRGPQQIRYNLLAAAATDLDLRVLDNRFEPIKWDGNAFGDNYAYAAVNGLDFCLKLAKTLDYEDLPDPRNGTTGVGNANAVAYSLAVPQRQGLPDITRSRSVADLSNALGCMTNMSAVNGISLAVEVVNEVQDEQESIRDSAIITIAFNVFNIAMAGLDVATAGVGLASSITTLAAASSLLAGAVASCIVLVGCAFIPVYTAAVTAASIAIGLFGAAIAASALAIGALVYSTALAVEVAIATGLSPGNTSPSVDLAAQLATVQQAEANATADELAATNAFNAMQQDITDRTNARNNITALRNAVDPNGDYDTQLNAAIAASEALNIARVAKDNADGLAETKRKRRDDLNASLVDAQTSCAGANLPSEQYKCDTRDRVLADRDAAQVEYNNALAAQTLAGQQLATATNTYNTALSNLNTAYNNINPILGNLMVTRVNNYHDAYYQLQNSTISYNALQQTAVQSRASAVAARNSYNELVAAVNNGGTLPGGSQVIAWSGAEAILRQSDAKGEVE